MSFQSSTVFRWKYSLFFLVFHYFVSIFLGALVILSLRLTFPFCYLCMSEDIFFFKKSSISRISKMFVTGLATLTFPQEKLLRKNYIQVLIGNELPDAQPISS